LLNVVLLLCLISQSKVTLLLTDWKQVTSLWT